MLDLSQDLRLNHAGQSFKIRQCGWAVCNLIAASVHLNRMYRACLPQRPLTKSVFGNSVLDVAAEVTRLKFPREHAFRSAKMSLVTSAATIFETRSKQAMNTRE